MAAPTDEYRDAGRNVVRRASDKFLAALQELPRHEDAEEADGDKK